MRIGIDARTLGTSRALGRYTRNLLRELAWVDAENQYFVFGDDSSSKVYDSLGIKRENWQLVLTAPKRLWRDHLFFASLANRYHLDIFFHPDNIEFLRMLLPSVVTIHDLMPYKFPDIILSSSGPKKLWQTAYFSVIASAIKSNTTKIITVSQHSKRDVMAMWRLPEERIQVIYEGAEEQFRKVGREGVTEPEAATVLASYHLSRPYLFYLGGLNRHKNVTTLISSYSLAVHKGLKAQLVIGGKTSSDNSTEQNVYREITEQVKSLGLPNKVVFPGFIAEEHLPIVYNQALAYVFPSLYEGFGFGPLEAMASGCPVVVSNAASLPEVVGEAGILVAPNDTESWAQEMLRVTSDESLRSTLRQKGLVQAQKFSWRRCAEETLEVFKRIIL